MPIYRIYVLNHSVLFQIYLEQFSHLILGYFICTLLMLCCLNTLIVNCSNYVLLLFHHLLVPYSLNTIDFIYFLFDITLTSSPHFSVTKYLNHQHIIILVTVCQVNCIVHTLACHGFWMTLSTSKSYPKIGFSQLCQFICICFDLDPCICFDLNLL